MEHLINAFLNWYWQGHGMLYVVLPALAAAMLLARYVISDEDLAKNHMIARILKGTITLGVAFLLTMFFPFLVIMAAGLLAVSPVALLVGLAVYRKPEPKPVYRAPQA